MPTDSIPIVVLGGSDRRPSTLPAGADQHPLRAYKGAEIRIADRPLIAHVVERLRACPEFDPILVAGPEQVYRACTDCEIVDTDGPLSTNIATALAALRARSHGGPVAMIACDVIPDRDELRSLLADYHARAPCDLWFPLIRAPRDANELGAFAWKPEYTLIPEPGADPLRVLPGHLFIAQPEALRLWLLFSLLQIAYRTRNRPVAERRRAMVAGVFGKLLRHDIGSLLHLRAPTVTWNVLRAGLGMARKLRAGKLLRSELEDAVTRVMVETRHRRSHPERGVRLPILDALSLAEDIDTEEEARAIHADA